MAGHTKKERGGTEGEKEREEESEETNMLQQGGNDWRKTPVEMEYIQKERATKYPKRVEEKRREGERKEKNERGGRKSEE